MIFSLVLLTAAMAIIADWFFFRRLKQRGTSRPRLLLYAVWAAATDALPLLCALSGLVLRDNPTTYGRIIMWAFWVWMVTVLPRMVCILCDQPRLRRTGVVLALIMTALLIWGATAGRTTLRIERVTICSGRLPAAMEGYRIAQLSDIHLGSIVRPEQELGRLVDSVNALRPDIVVFTGDLVNVRSSELDTLSMRLLGRLEAPVYAVTGNHDVGTYIRDTVALPREKSLACLLNRERAMGWHILDNQTVYLRRGDDSISLSGISYDPSIRHRRHDTELPPADLEQVYRDVPDSLFNITLMHLPQLWKQVLGTPYGDLALAGHVHSMQMKLHVGRWSWSPAAWLYEQWSGRYDRDGRTLYINDGTGYVAYPMRLGAWPEITLFTLERCK